MLEGVKVLVTGATGQVARPIAEQLNGPCEVWAAARFSDAAAKQELESQGINTVFYSLEESELSHLPEVDYVIHCGCNTDPKTPEQGLLQNAEGPGFLMQRYRDVKAFFHMSSSSVYTLAGDPSEAISEDAQLGGFASYSPHYAMSKQSAEAVVRFQARALNLPTIIARLDVAYGSRGHGGAPMALVEFMKHGIPYQRSEQGDSFCSPIHEDDIVAQVQGLLMHACVPAQTVNLGGDETVAMEQILAYIESLTGLKATVNSGPQATWQMTVLDSSKRKELAGPCRVQWQDGIQRALRARYPELLN